MVKSVLELVIGKTWLPRSDKIQQLQEQFKLPPAAATSLNQVELSQVKPKINTPELISPPAPVNSIKPVASDEKARPSYQVYASWKELIEQATNCRLCQLCEQRTKVVIERGERTASWFLVGEGPGEQEDATGLPFVGPAGQLLNKMVAAIGLDSQQDIYVTNVVKCRPPHNRNPELIEIEACKKFLTSQIALVKPKIILACGRFAAQTLLDTSVALGKLRSKAHYYQQIPVIVTYHPAYLLRNPSAKSAAWADLQLAVYTYTQLGS